MQSTGSQSLPINYYAPLSQRSTVSNDYNILDQTQTSTHVNNQYPDFHQGTHDPSMAQYRAAAQQIAQGAIQQIQQQAYGAGATFNTQYDMTESQAYTQYAAPNAESTSQPYLQIPNNIQTVAAFVASMAPQLIAMGAMQVTPQQNDTTTLNNSFQNAWQPSQQGNALSNDIRSDILNHLAKGNVHIHIDEEEEPEVIDMMDPIAIHKNAQIWGDPHFVGADGGKFDVQGEAGKTYNILSDKNLQMNAEFVAWGNSGATAIGRSGITIGTDQVEVSKNGAITINGTEYNDNGLYLDDMVEKLGGRIFIRSDEYDIEFITKGSHMDIHFDSENAVSDNILPQGLWGGTVDGDGYARNGDQGKGVQGGGGIMTLDGTLSDAGDKDTVKLYEIDDIFNNDFNNFNRFFS